MANNTVIPTAEVSGIGSWKYRRNFMYVTTAFCMATVGGVLLGDKTGDVAEIAVQSSYWLLFGITFLYVFGVSVQDLVALRTGYGIGSTIRTNKTVLETTTAGPLVPADVPIGDAVSTTTIQSSKVGPADGTSN